jgi:hypothetical protein
MYGECGSFTFGADDVDSTSMQFDEDLHDVKADAGADDAGGPAASKEAVE